MDTSLVVLAVALLAVVLANVVVTFGAFAALRDATLKITALRDAGAAEAVTPRKQARSHFEPPPLDENSIDPAAWSTDYARDLENPLEAPGNGRA